MLRVQDAIIVICLYFTAFASLESPAMNSVALYLALPIAFLLSLWKNVCVEIDKYVNKYEWILFFLLVWIFISYLWADYYDLASQECHRCLGSLLLSFIFASNATNKKMIPWLYLTFVVLYISAWIYAQNHILIDVTGAFERESSRLSDAKLNANTMAYYTFFNSFILFMFGEIIENSFWKKVCRIVFLGVIPLSFVVALVTASRQVLVIQIPLVSFMLYYRYWEKVKWTYRIIAVTVLVISCFAMSGFVSSTYENSFLAKRSEQSWNEDGRYVLFERALETGFENFPLGVGAGNFRAYGGNISHCSFAELWANQGIIGVALYLWLICSFFKKQWQNYNITKNRVCFLFIGFCVFFIVDNFFYVFYTDLWLISFFILVATHGETYSKEHYSYLIYERRPMLPRL